MDASTDIRQSTATFSRETRIWLTVLALAAIVWLGGLIMRAMIANEFFIPGTLQFDPVITFDQERILFQLISAASTVVLIAYGVVLVSAIFVLRTIPLTFRDNGWLLMAALLFFLFVPVELFTGWLDFQFVTLWNATKDRLDIEGMDTYFAHSTFMRSTLSHRIGALGGLPVMATLCYFTCVVIIVLQPLRRRHHSS